MVNSAHPISWFEIPVNDMERAMKFYESVLGVKLAPFKTAEFDMAWFPSGQVAGGAAGALMKAENYVPSHAGTMVYFAVDDVDGTLKTVETLGGKVLNRKTSVGHCEDCEGNRVAVHSKQLTRSLR